eukprot:TRINITY_DN15480_c0_g1_i1.p1 TRINITY_DN15480_c0_g1~~TRINITY_DN15480_c0_g1_i1.p1  ORF type:complete len:189 (+),score=36.68 TRINITY_DN15480_c0_g1_i1:233-799(+)
MVRKNNPQRKKKQKKSRKHGDAEWVHDFKKFQLQLQPFGLTIKDVAGDGNCLFRAIADQLEEDPKQHEKYRKGIVSFIASNREMFEPFIEDDEPFADYIKRMGEDGEWGGNIELQATSLLYRINIIIHQLDAPRYEVVNFYERDIPSIQLSYHGGEHYASVKANLDINPALTIALSHTEKKSDKDKSR